MVIVDALERAKPFDAVDVLNAFGDQTITLTVQPPRKSAWPKTAPTMSFRTAVGFIQPRIPDRTQDLGAAAPHHRIAHVSMTAIHDYSCFLNVADKVYYLSSDRRVGHRRGQETWMLY